MSNDPRHHAWKAHQVAEELSSVLAARVEQTPEGRRLWLSEDEQAALRSLALRLTTHLSVVVPSTADTPTYKAFNGADELAPYLSEDDARGHAEIDYQDHHGAATLTWLPDEPDDPDNEPTVFRLYTVHEDGSPDEATDWTVHHEIVYAEFDPNDWA